ncbi:ricin-type beta-trefoil lectin domain protein [Actinoplanes sp. NPDC020271]|uniref:ricin-type beta-trefoil lectin domain protein n=1 Tax=Actinoplanes sp. NPDC020271 TaxID=3363896 RepID=UPI0037A474C6
MRRLTRFLAALTTGMAASAPVVAPPPLHQGWIRPKADDSRCLTGGAAGTILSLRPCGDGTAGQEWFQASTGKFYNGENCIRSEGTVVRVAACNGADPAQEWWFVDTIRNGRYGPCLTEEHNGQVRLRACTGRIEQKWVSTS